MAKVKRKTRKEKTKQKDKDKAFKGDYLVIAPSKKQADSIASRTDDKVPRLYLNLPRKTSTANANKFFKPYLRISPKNPRLK